jgi:hypothetical protein
MDNMKKEKLQIEKLIDAKYSLKKPITVNIKIDKQNYEYVGDIPELELYSYGIDKLEVLRELNEELTELFEKLINMNENKLGKFSKKWKNILKKYVGG